MIKSTLKISLLCLVAAALASTPARLNAQETNKHAEKKIAKEKSVNKPSTTPFHGKLKAIDKTAKTITVGETTIQVTSDTKIVKDEKPATLEDGVVGETVSGAYKKSEDGKLSATKVRFGAKAEANAATGTTKEKKEKKDK